MHDIREIIPDMRKVKPTAHRFGLPEHLVRQLVYTGKIVFIRAGAKGTIYINQQSMINYLNTGSGVIE